MLPPGPLLTPALVLSSGKPSKTAITLVLIKTTTKLQTSFPKPCVLFLPLSTSHPSPSAVSVMLPQEPQLEMAQILALLPLQSFQLSIAPCFICPRCSLPRRSETSREIAEPHLAMRQAETGRGKAQKSPHSNITTGETVLRVQKRLNSHHHGQRTSDINRMCHSSGCARTLLPYGQCNTTHPTPISHSKGVSPTRSGQSTLQSMGAAQELLAERESRARLLLFLQIPAAAPSHVGHLATMA